MELPEDGGAAIAMKIRSGKGGCISDESLKEIFGTSAFKFMMGKIPTYIGRNRIPGTTDRDQDSYRSEICGMLENVIVINAICEAHNITEEYKITMRCDNISALRKSFDDADTRQTDASSDILMAIRYQMKKSPLKWQSKWVPGHQDDGETPTVLDEWAWENVHVDELAGEYWTKMLKELIPEDQDYWERANNRFLLRPESTKMPGEAWQLQINGEKIVGRFDLFMYEHCHKKDTIDYWISQGRIARTEESIDWESHGKAMKAFGARKH